jgi:16S rRNA (guanine(527)-N(7))-methyltransferase RsmG
VKHGRDDVSALQAQAEALGVPISTEGATRILELESGLRVRAARAGALSSGEIPKLRERHILDSLRAASEVARRDHDAYDLGSGAGLPGLPVAIATPWLHVGLVERRDRRAGLLEWLVERLGLPNVQVLARPIEDLTAPADLCFARALAPLERAWTIAAPLLRASGRLVYFAGPGARIPSQMPGSADVRLVPPQAGLLERAGPLVIMTRE